MGTGLANPSGTVSVQSRMTLRILFTLAILAGLAAAPDAQTFRWEAGSHNDVAERVERALERARQRVDRGR